MDKSNLLQVYNGKPQGSYFAGKTTVSTFGNTTRYFFQMEDLDRDIIFRQEIKENKYKPMVFVLATYICLISLDIKVYESVPIEFLIGCNYYLIVLVNFSQTLLVKGLTEHLERKFALLNKIFQREKKCIRNLRKAFPINKIAVLVKFEIEDVRFRADIITDIVQKHHNLTTIARKLNASFDFPILITILISLQIATTSFYNFLRLAAASTTFNLSSIALLTITFLWPLLLILELVFIVNGFERMTEKEKLFTKKKDQFMIYCLQARETSTLIHELWNFRGNKDRKLAAVLQLASVKLLLTRPIFTVRGLLPLNMTLMRIVKLKLGKAIGANFFFAF